LAPILPLSWYQRPAALPRESDRSSSLPLLSHSAHGDSSSGATVGDVDGVARTGEAETGVEPARAARVSRSKR
jgi:hypothetical protein